MKSCIPKNFRVEDSDREYSVKKGWPLYLPDVFLTDFREYHEVNETIRYSNWRAAFKRWMRMNSPSGGYYKPWIWERKVNDAKEMESAQYPRQEEPRRAEAKPRPMPDETRTILERMRRQT